MSEAGKEDSMNVNDETRKQMREKQQAETERQQKTCGELFNRPTDKTRDRLRGKNNE